MATAHTTPMAPVWPGPRLIVPMAVDCLLVGAPDVQGSNWARTLFNYQNLALGLGDAAPPPFSLLAEGEKPAIGAHLAWTLPYALRRGAAAGDDDLDAGAAAGELNFPLIPNRWLVLRAQYDDAGNAPVLSARVILSDHLEAARGTIPLTVSQYPQPGQNAATAILGRVVDLSEWDGAAPDTAAFLRAIAPGDVSWSAAYDNLRNVLTLHDPLADAAAHYGYSVIGWYSDPASDPLNGLDTTSAQAWRADLERRMGWSVGDGASAVRQAVADWTAWAVQRGVDHGAPAPDLPKQLEDAIGRWGDWREAHGRKDTAPDLPVQMMLSGLLLGVDWRGSDMTYGSGAPGGGQQTPAVAVGNTATEAIAAWIAHTLVEEGKEDPTTIPLIERAVEAFQAGLLIDLEKTPGQTEAWLQARQFAAEGQRREWVVVRPENASDAKGDASVPLDQAQTDALTVLNCLQQQADDLQALLTAQQSEYFALVWKGQNIPRNAAPDAKARLTAATAALEQGIRASAAALNALSAPAGRLAQAQAALVAALAGAYDLRLVARGPSYRPNDPIFLIAGSAGDAKYAGPGTYDDNDTLICRVTGQSVTGLDLSTEGAGIASLDAGGVLQALTLPTADPLPKEAPDLWLELLFSDPGAAPYLARCALTIGGGGVTPDAIARLAARIAAMQSAPWHPELAEAAAAQVLGHASGLTGHLPAAPAVTFRTDQPWSPVFVDWKLSWAPAGDDFDQMLSKWDLGPEDFVWTGGKVTPPATPLIFEARTVYDPKVAQDLSRQLAAFKGDSDYDHLPDFTRKALDLMVGLMGRADLFTLSASGFTQQLLTRIIAPNQDVPEAQDLIGNAPVGFRPVPGIATGSLPAQPFFPLRAGHLRLMDLRIVDAWGQILTGKPPLVAPDLPVPDVIRAQSVLTPPFAENGQDANRDYVQLAPRLSDAARIDLELLDAGDDAILSNSADRTSPICGYVIPNNLDISLAVFNGRGASSGAVLKIQTERTAQQGLATGLRWQLPPGLSAPLGAGPRLANRHMQALVQGLLAQGMTGGGAALDDLFDHIDSALWSIAPLGLPTQGAGTLTGPPLAVVRARISARITGRPSFNQSWGMTGDAYRGDKDGKPVYDPRPVPIMSLFLPARLGDTGIETNGVMGYFVDDDYSRFYAVYGAGGQTRVAAAALRAAPVARGGLAARLGVDQAATASDYVETDHLLHLPLDGRPVNLTILLDPRGQIPLTSGWQPEQSQGLAPGPVSDALAAMVVDFRAGPLLCDPHDIRMPLPSELRGNWAWAARADITGWAPDEPVRTATPVAQVAASPLHLSEGWLTLTGAFAPQKEAER